MDYIKLVKLYEKLDSTTKRLEKTKYLADVIRQIPDEELESSILLIEGKIFPTWDEHKLGIADKIVIKALARASGIEEDVVIMQWKKTGNLGDTAEALLNKKRQSTLFTEPLSTQKVFAILQKIAFIEGQKAVDTKIKYLIEVLSNASPQEAKYIIRTVLEDLRIGFGDGTLRDAIVWAYNGQKLKLSYDAEKNLLVLPDNVRTDYEKEVARVQNALDITNDFAEVIRLVRTNLLDQITLTPGKPLNVMLYPKAESISSAFETVGRPAAFEYKFDGFRLQIHKSNNVITLFTRRLENVTAQFPDVVKVAQRIPASAFIIDSEAVGIEPTTNKPRPFQSISQRIRRKYDIELLAKQFPVQLMVFDIMHLEGQSTLTKEFLERRRILERIILLDSEIKLAEQLVTNDDEQAEKFYMQALAQGHEGVIAKNIHATYQPGKRVGGGVKIKPTLDTLEVVIIGAEWGSGKRSKWLSSFTVAIKDPDLGLCTIGKVATGLKEKAEEGTTFEEISELLKQHIITENGKDVTVKPLVVIEVDYEEIQKSPTYTSGYALRFPRFVRLRLDRGPNDCSTTEDIKRIYESQRGRN